MMSYTTLYWFRLAVIAMFVNVLGVSTSFGQSKSDLSKYEYAKSLIAEKKYAPAIVVLQRFVDEGSSNVLYLNAMYMQAVASFHLGKIQDAREKTFKITQQYPNWAGTEEAYLLLATIDFKNEMPEQAMKNLAKINSKELKMEAYHLKKNELSNYAVIKLKALHTSYPKDEAIGRVLLAALYKEADWQREQPLIEKLEALYNPQVKVVEAKSTLKSSYAIGLLFPFNEGQITVSSKPNFVLDLYEGAKMAAQDLAVEGITVKLHAFDTQRDSMATIKLLQDPELQKLDLMVGPIYPELISPAQNFSTMYQVPMVNPVLEDAEVTDTNNLSFTLSANSVTQATFTAEYAFKELKSVTGYIVYGTKDKDVVAMESYAKRFKEMGGIIKEKIQFSSDENAYKNMSRKLAGIGNAQNTHVFVASSELSLANTLISTLQTMGATKVTILAPKRWLEFPQLSFGRMESANVQFYCTLYLDEMAKTTKDFNAKYLSTYSITPSKYSFMGYEAVYYFGKMLAQYGTDFPSKMHEDSHTTGKLFGDISYIGGNDNQAMKMATFKQGIFHILYPKTSK